MTEQNLCQWFFEHSSFTGSPDTSKIEWFVPKLLRHCRVFFHQYLHVRHVSNDNVLAEDGADGTPVQAVYTTRVIMSLQCLCAHTAGYSLEEKINHCDFLKCFLCRICVLIDFRDFKLAIVIDLFFKPVPVLSKPLYERFSPWKLPESKDWNTMFMSSL